jgi:hypothetical protein
MRHYVAYHKVEEHGEYKPKPGAGYGHYSRFSRKRLEKIINQTLWVVSGTRENQTMVYRLCSVYTPTAVQDAGGGEFRVYGKQGVTFRPHVELNDFEWFWDLWDEQRNFSLGMNQIKNETVIAELLQLKAQQSTSTPNLTPLPEEVTEGRFYEGATKQITVNAYERDRQARLHCIKHYGATCSICGFDFEKMYGAIGAGYIHVHHLKPLSEIGEKYQVNPIEDLRPVCPNCHAMIHVKKPAYTINEMKVVLKKSSR